MLQAMDAFEHRLLTGQMIAQRLVYARQIFGMHELLPIAQIDLIVGVAEHRLPTRRKVRSLVLEIEVPNAVVRTVQGELAALFHVRELRCELRALEAARIA